LGSQMIQVIMNTIKPLVLIERNQLLKR